MGIAGTFTLAPLPQFDGKVDTDMWIPVHLVDTTDDQTGETAVAFGNIDCDYQVGGSTSWTSYTVGTTEWKEIGEGVYWLKIGASEFTTAGNYIIRVADDTPVGHKFLCCVQVTTSNIDDVVDSSGRVDVGQFLGNACTVSAGGMPDVNVAEISEDSDAADSLEGAIDNTNDVIFSDVTRIGTSTTAVTNAKADYDGTGYAGGTIKASVNAAQIGGQTASLNASNLLNVNVEQWQDTTASKNGTTNKPDVHVHSWAGTAVTASSTSNLPEVDAKSISDSTTAADNVQANIGNLDAAVTTRSTLTQAQVTGGAYALDTDANGRMRVVDGTGTGEINTTSGAVDINMAQMLPGSPTDDTVGQALKESSDLDTDANGRIRVVDGTGTGEINTTGGFVNVNLAQAISEGQTALTVGASLERTYAAYSHRVVDNGVGGTVAIYRADGTTPLVSRTKTATELNVPA